jgi:hypothetical protein
VRAPRFRFSFEIEEWIVLAFDAVDGAIPQQPWRDGELANVVQAISDLADILTPSPIPNVSPMSEVMGDEFQTFARLLRDGVSGPLCRVDLDGSVQERLADLASLEAGWRVAAAGSTLTHHDLRVDNILIDRDGNVWIVDWSSPCLAAPWVDIATFLPTIRREPKEMERLFLSTSAGLSATPRDVDRFVAALAGMWFERSSRPIVEHAPHLRDHQRRCAQAAFDWLRFRCFDIDTEAVVS